MWKEIRDTIKLSLSGGDIDFTKGSIRKALVVLSIPMILEMVMESLFAVVDVYFVSRLGNEAVATVGLTESLMYIVYSIGIGISMAATAMVARRIGEKDARMAGRTTVQAFYLVLFFGILISIFGIIYAKDLLRLMGGSQKVVEEMSVYTTIVLASNFVILFLFLFNGVFRGCGDAHLAMRVLWIANIINIILDPCLIFGLGPFPELGLKGAAIATATGRGIGVIYQLYLLFRGVGNLKPGVEDLKLYPGLLKKIFRVSLGGMGQFLIETASWIALVRLISEFGDAALAAYTISIRVIVFTILPSWGLANAAATLVGQNLGAGEPDRSARSVWLAATYNVTFLLFVSILFFFTAGFVISLFTDDLVVIKEGTRALRIICTGYIAFAFGMVLGQAFNGAGDTRTPTWVNLICFWFLQIPLAYVLAFKLQWGSAGVYWSIAISHSLLAVIFIVLFSRGKWQKVQV